MSPTKLFCVVMFRVSILPPAELCIVLKHDWHSVFLDSFEDGFDCLGGNPELISKVSIHQCVQSCFDQGCKTFMHAADTGTCWLSTTNFFNCSKTGSFLENLVYISIMLFYPRSPACHSSSILPLGMESGHIPNSAITASYNRYYSHLRHINKDMCRLNVRGGWSSPWEPHLTSHHYWIAVDFESTVIIHEIATQGCSDCAERWVKKFSVQYSTNSLSWRIYMNNGQKKIFDANTDSTTAVSNTFHPPIVARGFKIYTEEITEVIIDGSPSPVLGLRFEIYGCWLTTVV